MQNIVLKRVCDSKVKAGLATPADHHNWYSRALVHMHILQANFFEHSPNAECPILSTCRALKQLPCIQGVGTLKICTVGIVCFHLKTCENI